MGQGSRRSSSSTATLASLQVARYSLYGFTAGYGIVFLGLVAHLVRSSHAYVRDAREATAGDLLV